MKNVDKWIEGLKKGYSQCRKTYARRIGPITQYCAVGVARDLMSKELNTPDKDIPFLEVEKWVGLEFQILDYVILMNDAGSSFEQIAEYLETLRITGCINPYSDLRLENVLYLERAHIHGWPL